MTTSANTTFVQNLYQNLLQRTGDTAGLDYWIARADGGMSAANMASAFIASPEAQNVTAVLHLYDVFFNRTADGAGLTYWVNALKSGTSLRDVANSFSASSEFQTKFAGTSTADYVEATYGNLFGRPSDAAGKAYWVQKLDSGSLNRAEVSLAFSLSPEAMSSTGAATRFTESYLVLRAAGTAEPSTSAVEALASKALSAALAEKVTGYGATFNVTGKLVDGYLSGATVFADANGDGVWNAGEAKATSDAKGNFTLADAKGAMVASGGTDLSTGKAFKGVLKATEGSTMINPLTSLQQGFVEKGLTVADAELKVAKALGLDASKFDLTTFDPLATSLDANASAADRALGAQLQAQAAKVANFMVAAEQTLIGAAGGANKLDAATAGNSLLDAMVNAINADSDGVVSFSDKAMLQSVMNDAVTLAGDADLSAASAKVAGMADEFAAMSAASADNIDKAVAAGGDVTAMMANIAQSQVVAQGAMADQMLAAAEGGDLAAMQTSFTGAAFDSAANKATIGDLDPNSTSDDAAAAASNSDAGAAATPTTPTTTTTPTPEPEPALTDSVAPTASVTTATIKPAGNAVVQSTETGTAYLVNTSVTVTNVASITGAADSSFNSATISAAATDTNLAATGLVDGTYKVYTVDAAGNLSSASTNSVTVDSTAPTISAGPTVASATTISLTSNEAGSAGLYDSTPALIGSAATMVAATPNTITVAAQSSVTTASLAVADAAANTATSASKVILGTTGVDAIGATTTTDVMFGFAGADVFTLMVGANPAAGLGQIADYAVNTSGESIIFGGTAAVWATVVATWTITNGVATKADATVTGFYSAFATATGAAGEVIAFVDGGNTYLFGEGAGTGDTDNTAVVLVGVAGTTAVAATAAANTILIS